MAACLHLEGGFVCVKNGRLPCPSIGKLLCRTIFGVNIFIKKKKKKSFRHTNGRKSTMALKHHPMLLGQRQGDRVCVSGQHRFNI